jgi:hypothetical protein
MNDVVLIISAQSFTESENVFDGLRLRTVGIASGLAANGIKVLIISHGSEETSFFRDGVEYSTWTSFESFVSIVAKYRFIIFNYASLGLNQILLSIIRPDQILVSDGIVPIALEESARVVKNRVEDMDSCVNLIHRSDVVLISSIDCQEYYLKFTSEINRSLENENLEPEFVVLPFGVNQSELISPSKGKLNYRPEKLRLVWYGGVYPWFGVTELELFIRELGYSESSIELTLVGVSNPFSLDSELKEISSRILNSAARSVHVRSVSWLPYETRLTFLSNFDAAIFFNDSSQVETSFSWRQRYADLILARLPLIVNSIDPFSRLMRDHGIAREISAQRILEANRVEGIRSDLSRDIQSLREDGNWELLTEYLEWKNATLQLSNWIQRKID